MLYQFKCKAFLNVIYFLHFGYRKYKKIINSIVKPYQILSGPQTCICVCRLIRGGGFLLCPLYFVLGGSSLLLQGTLFILSPAAHVLNLSLLFIKIECAPQANFFISLNCYEQMLFIKKKKQCRRRTFIFHIIYV